MSARTGIREPGFTIGHVGPIRAGLIAAIAIAAGLGLAIVARPAAVPGAPATTLTADAVQFRAGERASLLAPTTTVTSDEVQFRAGERASLLAPTTTVTSDEVQFRAGERASLLAPTTTVTSDEVQFRAGERRP